MMNLKNKALVFNFISFTLLFLGMRYFIVEYLAAASIIKSIIAAILTMILAPKFMVMKTKEGTKLVMKWLFVKGFKTF
ncbi:hypothetical protein [Cellulophaga sp. Hel_I_12]|uniref:hypothetical protein n=1 Tax=Cellulophaga sp. Hel_I_12 TaxID=1249972 RepID=UPI0006909EA0|nr:hypothetical protein [Cellulophaga sp. Hel_I_12]